VSAPGTYSGFYYSPVGDKGRYVLPPAIRKEVKESSGGSKILCLGIEGEEECLTGFGTSRIDRLQQELNDARDRAVAMQDTSFNYKERAQALFGFEQVPFDDSGRFVMPEYLRDLGMVDKGLFFQGAGDFFLIWEPEVLFRQGPSYRAAQASCRKLMAEAQAKAAKKGGAQ
jgi:MraZ protein